MLKLSSCKIKKVLASLLLVFFVVSVTAVAVSAEKTSTASERSKDTTMFTSTSMKKSSEMDNNMIAEKGVVVDRETGKVKAAKGMVVDRETGKVKAAKGMVIDTETDED